MKPVYFYVKSTSNTEGAGLNGSYDEKIPTSSENLWDGAHQLVDDREDFYYAEPDLDDNNPEVKIREAAEGAVETIVQEDQYDPDWPFPTVTDRIGQPFKKIWHLDDQYSQLRSAWTSKEGDQMIRIGHFDTGYDPEHTTFPAGNVETELERNFVEKNTHSAVDVGSEGWFKQPGHGTGTLSILAGNLVSLPDYDNYNDYLGIHRNVKIVPVRISSSVILWKNKAFVDALDYIISLYDNEATRVHIVTMSMGGLPSKAWADVVNRAYEKGIFIVTAAGNNIGRLTPTTLGYPARFSRVTAACGVTFDRSPYYQPFSVGGLNCMQGNFGPEKAMKKAIAAFTPNVPWAVYKTGNVVSINGAGTSSATPQIAAAAALYYQKYGSLLDQMQGWQRVEAIRRAMFTSADKNIKEGYDDNVLLYFGNGILQAAKMLEVIPSVDGLVKENPARVRFPFLKLITGTGMLESALVEGNVSPEQKHEAMYEVEILQLIAISSQLQQLLKNEELSYDELDAEEQKKFWLIIMEMAEVSNSLKAFIERYQLTGNP